MPDYSHRGTCAVPVSMVSIANAIWKALDPDVGGDSSFDILRGTDQFGAELAITSALCTSDFAAQASHLIANPQALHAVVAQDYTQRWEGLDPPNLADVEAFCSTARIVVTTRDGTLEDHLASISLKLL